jgi:hypothetical protein
VLDPFCGRGTTPFQALLMGRRSIGCDTNPVAYCVSRAKTNAPPMSSLIRRIDELELEYSSRDYHHIQAPTTLFFRNAYHPDTLSEIMFLRHMLRYKQSKTDCMLTALVLGSLHGESQKSSRFLSNQMPHTISTKPNYSVKFWKDRNLIASRRDTFELLRQQAVFRYSTKRPAGRASIFEMDMRELPRLPHIPSPIRCVITSPPYFDVTNYAEDQWLRLWFIGGAPYLSTREFARDDRHGSEDKYWTLLADMWRTLGLTLAPHSDIVIRLGASRISPKRLLSCLEGVSKSAKRRVRLVAHETSEIRRRQTDAFRPGSIGCKFEIDCHFNMT